jgi:hypothetical protein
MTVLDKELTNARPEPVGDCVPPEVHLEEHVRDPRVVLPLLLAFEDVPELEEEEAVPDIHTRARPLQGWHEDGSGGELLRGGEGVSLKVVKERKLYPAR